MGYLDRQEIIELKRTVRVLATIVAVCPKAEMGQDDPRLPEVTEAYENYRNCPAACKAVDDARAAVEKARKGT